MNTISPKLIEWGRERARAGPWRGNPTVAYLAPVPGAPIPSPAFVQRCLESLSNEGFTRVVTGALAPAEQPGFRAAGFLVTEDLHLLSRDVRRPSTLAAGPNPALLRRAQRRDRPRVLIVDALAFEPFWRLDDAGLDEAVAATPHARFRVAVAGNEEDSPVLGYAITGRAGRRGYLQRLAVHPDQQRRGLGTSLVDDALRWLRRWRVERAMVNTQLGNEKALALYERCGFVREPSRLSVLAVDLA